MNAAEASLSARSRARIRTRFRCPTGFFMDMARFPSLVGSEARLFGERANLNITDRLVSRLCPAVHSESMATHAGRDAPSPELVRARVRGLPRRFRHESCDGLSAEWELRVGSQRFAIAVAGGACTVREGPAAAPQAVIATQPGTWLAIDEGLISGGQAFLEQRLTATGNLDLAVRLQTLFRPHRRVRRLADLDQVEVGANGLRLSSYVLGR